MASYTFFLDQKHIYRYQIYCVDGYAQNAFPSLGPQMHTTVLFYGRHIIL